MRDPCWQRRSAGHLPRSGEHAGVAVVQGWLDAHPDTSVKRVIFDVFSKTDQVLYAQALGYIGRYQVLS